MLARCAVALAALATLCAFPAEARFGKRSRPADDDEESKPKRQHSASSSSSSSSASSNDEHAATAVGQPAPAHPHRPRAHVRARPRLLFGFSSAAYVPAPPAAVGSSSPPLESSPLRVTASGDVHGFFGGASLGVGLGFEGERVGLTGNFSHLAVLADDGSGDIDRIQQLNLHLTYALLAGDSGRFRLEAGLDTAVAPDLIAVGPTVGVSGVLWLFGPLALEGSAMLTPFPYRQLEWRGGVGLGLGPVGLRAGWRTLLLDDAGLVDGIAHQDIFSGPYLGLALVF
ncbi:MAG: hypothetical protein HYZ28_01290 [Myxococcales bacterium]|nr:hypothetical protein [Myxococcales bacterium]